MQNTTVKHGNMLLKYLGGEGESFKMYRIEPISLNSSEADQSSQPNFFLSLASDGAGSSLEGCASACGHYDNEKCVSLKITKKGLCTKYLCDGDSLEVTVKMEFIKGSDAIRQINSIKNISNTPRTVTHFSSAVLSGLAMGGLKKWFEDDSKVKVHYCYSHWQGEAQWREDSLEHLGIYRKTMHSWDSISHRFHSIGSWSTGRYYPLIMLEDTETGSIWYAEIEGGFNWTLEIGSRNSSDGMLFIEANAAEEETGFAKVLKPGEVFTAAPAIFGCTNGSFEEAVKQLTIAKRATSLTRWNSENVAPACFNTYMDCIWGAGNEKSLPPLIDRAAEAGIELFCLDAGWYAKGCGDWTINDKLYGEKGLKGIFDYIKSKGMTPGAWFEIESLEKGSELYNMGNLLARNGSNVSGGHFADFTQKETCDFLEEKIDALYSIGMRFIKNDYNLSTLFGAEIDSSSPAEGLKKHIEAFYAFIDKMMAKYPDLRIENCGSGGMRMDCGTLRHFNLQSTSDQELYYFNPAIASGCAAVMPPEKAGIWAYPYPVTFYNRKKDIFSDSNYMDSMKDGEQTVFNMVTALCGTLYLSGRIDMADDFNVKLINDGVAAYKKYRTHLSDGFPIWPCGKLSITDKTHSALGFISPDKKKITLAVWKFEENSDVITIDLSKYLSGKKVTAELAYPKTIETEYVYSEGSCKLSVKMPKKNTARFFDITVD